MLTIWMDHLKKSTKKVETDSADSADSDETLSHPSIVADKIINKYLVKIQ